MLEFLRRQLKQLLDERAALKTDLDGVLATPQAEQRDLNATEAAAFAEKRAALVAKDTEVEEMRGRIAQAEEDEAREARVAQIAVQTGQVNDQRQIGGARVGHEPVTYERGGQHSYFRDLTVINMQRSGATAAMDRMTRSAQEARVEQRALSTTDGAGGEFVPPAWMIQDFITLARAARPWADRVRHMQLPTGTDSVNVPRIVTGTAVAEQATQNTAVQNTDATTGSVTANVATLAGQQVVALQLIEQSPVNMDELLLADLAADYAVKVDKFALTNNATGKKGILSAGGTAVTYTDASPTVGELYPKLMDAAQRIQGARYLPADTILMHPRRWAWLLSALDTQNRPLVVPNVSGPVNAIGTMDAVSGQGVVGSIGGIDVVLDSSLPTNLGGGTNEDVIVVARASDSVLWEGTPRSEAFRETKADQLSVLLRFYNYVAYTSERYVSSAVIIGGTGLVAPTF